MTIEGLRVGIGHDTHRLEEGRPLILGGQRIAHPRGLLGHSDADVVWNVKQLWFYSMQFYRFCGDAMRRDNHHLVDHGHMPFAMGCMFPEFSVGEELLNQVWGYQNYPSTRTVDNHILKLRQKLEGDPSNPVHFRTFHGAGYKFVP